MSLSIDYSDATGLHVYAFLFSGSDKTKAFNPTREKFATFSLSSQGNFVIALEESDQRVGFYTYEIEDVSDIAMTKASEPYLIEVYKRVGDSPDRRTDKLLGTQTFYWDGEKEVSLQELADLIGKHDAAQGVLPNAQVPRLGPRGSSAGSGGIRFSR